MSTSFFTYCYEVLDLVEKIKSTMARKCKRDKCGVVLPAIDGHVFCESCRSLGKGDDPCVKGRTCKLCDNYNKSKDEERRRKDDELLDQPDKSMPSTASQASPWEKTLAQLNQIAAQMETLNNRVSSIESVSKGINPSTTLSSTAKGSTVKNTGSASASAEGSEAVIEVHSDNDNDNEETASKQETLPDRDTDPSLVEIIQAVKNLLDLPDTLSDTVKPPSAFYKKPSIKATKKELAAFPPEEDVQAMWQYRQQQAAGKDIEGKTSHSPLHSGQFLPFIRVLIDNYISTPQGASIKPQQIPESFSDLSKAKHPSSVEIPMRQFYKMERAMRETCQILERLVFYKKAVSELNGRIQNMAEDALLPDNNAKELLELLLSSNSMQSRIFDTIEYSLETVLNQVMTMVCNLSLSKRDALLKNCKGLSTDDTLLLRNSSFMDVDLFPHDLISQAENNMLKRSSSSASKSSAPPSKKPRREEETTRQHSFRGYNSYNARGRSQRGSYRGGNQAYRGSQASSRHASRRQ